MKRVSTTKMYVIVCYQLYVSKLQLSPTIFSIQLQLKLNTNLLENAHILPNAPDVKNK